MNERINQMWADCVNSSVPSRGRPMNWQVAANKFAELIVRECLDIVEDEDTGDVYGKSVRLAMIRIKQHFGVEE